MNNDYEKPKAPIINADGNVFNLIGICVRALKKAGYSDKANEMSDKVLCSGSYDEALAIMCEYIEPVDQNYNSLEEYDFDDNEIEI